MSAPAPREGGPHCPYKTCYPYTHTNKQVIHTIPYYITFFIICPAALSGLCALYHKHGFKIKWQHCIKILEELPVSIRR